MKNQKIDVSCLVRRKPTKLSLNLKGKVLVYMIPLHCSMIVQKVMIMDCLNVELAPTGVNYVDFGQVHINDTVYKRVVIHNSGNSI